MKRRLKLKKYAGGGDISVGDAMGTAGDAFDSIGGLGKIFGMIMKGVGVGANQLNKESAEMAEKWKNQFDTSGQSHPQPNSPVMMALGGEFLKQFNSPSHAEGGQAIDANGNPAPQSKAVAEIEKNETVADGYAFSPNLVDALSGKTFADASIKIEKKYKKRIENGNDISRRTRDKEMNRLKGANDAERAKVEQAQAQQLATILQAIAPQQPQQSMPQQAHGGYLNKLAPGGPINPNDNPYNFATFDDTKGMFGSDKELQQSIIDYGKSIGQDYLPKYGADGKIGDETKGFFSDPTRTKGFSDYMNKKSKESKSLTFGSPSGVPSHPNQLAPLIASNMPTRADSGMGAAENVDLHEMLAKDGIKSEDLEQAFADGIAESRLIDKSGNIVPHSVQRANMAATSGNIADGTDAEASADGTKKGKDGLKKFWNNLQEGKYTSTIGTGLKVGEVIGQTAMALRNPEQIKTQLNERAREAEHELRKRGQQLTAARTRNEQALAQTLSGNKNAMSQAVKFALDQVAHDKAASREIDIAGKEKALNDNVSAQLANMITRHGTEDKMARNLQEVKQSQTNAVSADAKKTLFETMGNAGEFFSKQAGAQKKAKEQMLLISQKYPNFKVSDLKTYNKAIQNGNIDNVVKFMKSKSITVEQALEDADNLGMSAADKKKLEKKLKKDGDK